MATRPAERSYAHRTRLEKLGAKPGAKVVLLGVTDEAIVSELATAGIAPSTSAATRGADIVLLQVDDPSGLARIPKAAKQIASAGGVWIVKPRGVPVLGDEIVIAAGKKAGLVDNKVMRFNDTHTAMRFVIPKEKRK